MSSYTSSILGLLTFINFLIFCECVNYLTLNISHREGSIIYLVEHEAMSLDSDKFYKDPVIFQTTSAAHYVTKSSQQIFTKKNPDMKKDSILLSSADNKFAIPTPRGRLKRQFVLLKKSENQPNSAETTPYYMSFMYIRKTVPDEKAEKVIPIDGVPSVLEYDIWEKRPTKFFAGWLNCDFTALFTCTSKRAMAKDALSRLESRRRKRASSALGLHDDAEEEDLKVRDHFLAKRHAGDHADKEEMLPMNSAPNDDPGEYNDLYLDFDLTCISHMDTADHTIRNHLGSQRRRRRRSAPLSKKKAKSKDKLLSEIIGDEESALPGTGISKRKGALASVWDLAEPEVIAKAASALETNMGYPPMWATLSALGTTFTVNAFRLVSRGYWLGWKLGADLAGTFLNGGKFRAKGFYEDDSITSNYNSMYGVFYGGCTGGKMFFIPAGTTLRVSLHGEDKQKISGYLKPGVPGKPDSFHAEKESDAQPYIDKKVKLHVEEFPKATGILGTLRKGGIFEPEVRKLRGMYDPHDTEWLERVCLSGAVEEVALPNRPQETKDGRVILYGYLFQGMEQSPNVFIAVGGTLSGFFVRVGGGGDEDDDDDEEAPKSTFIIHGVLTPTFPGGHATFIADKEEEVKDVLETRGFFIPDAMELGGGLSGLLIRFDGSDRRFLLNLDKPSVEFTYIPDTPEVKNVWCNYLKPEDWKYIPGEDMEGKRTTIRKWKRRKKLSRSKQKAEKAKKEKEAKEAPQDAETPAEPPPPAEDENVQDADQINKRMEYERYRKEKKSFGLVIKTKKTAVFFPINFMIEAFVFITSKNNKMSPVSVTIELTSTEMPMPLSVTKVWESKNLPDNPKDVGEAQDCVLIPARFTKNDYIPGKIKFESGGEKATFESNIQTQSHFFMLDNDHWTPVGFKERLKNENPDDPKPGEMAEQRAREKAQKDFDPSKIQFPGKRTARKKRQGSSMSSHGLIPKPSNYKFGPKFLENNPDLNTFLLPDEGSKAKGRSLDEAPEIFLYTQHDELEGLLEKAIAESNAAAHEYIPGVFMKSKESPDPIFIPNTGAFGVFFADGSTTDKGDVVVYFHERPFLMPETLLARNRERPMPIGTVGKFHTYDSGGKLSKGWFRCRIGKFRLEKEPEDAPIEILPGWMENHHMIKVTKDTLPEWFGENLDPQHLDDIFSEESTKFALVDISGGFKGVMVLDPEGAMDTPNNPIFQEYLHFRAKKDGDVNPWGSVKIVDVIQRHTEDNPQMLKSDDDGDGESDKPKVKPVKDPGIKKVKIGKLVKEVDVEGTMASTVMESFRIKNWAYSGAYDMVNVDQEDMRKALSFGEMVNVASMMDFRLYLHYKYSLKTAKVAGETVYLYVPKYAEEFLTVMATAKPINALTWRPLVSTEDEGVLGFSDKFGLDPVEIQRMDLSANIEHEVEEEEAAAGGGKRRRRRMAKMSVAEFTRALLERRKRQAYEYEDEPGDNAGEENDETLNSAEGVVREGDDGEDEDPDPDSDGKTGKYEWKVRKWRKLVQCDEIKLDDFEASQALEAMKTKAQTGVELGLELVKGQGDLKGFVDVATLLFQEWERRKVEGKEKKCQMGESETDLLGGTSEKLERELEEGDSSSFAAICNKKKKRKGMAGRSLGGEEQEEANHAKVLPGWKTQHRAIVNNETLSANGLIFYGLGNCPQMAVPDIQDWTSDPEKLIDYYLKTMRMDCMEKAKERIVNLVNGGFLKLDGEAKFFIIPQELPLLTLQRLLPEEIQKLSVAFEFHAFTSTYCYIRDKGYLPEGILHEPHVNISRSGGFLTELSFYIISKAFDIVPMHGVRMIRNQLSTLRTVLTKLHQDALALAECATCHFDKMLTAGDKFRIVSLIQFIIYGQGPFQRKEVELREAFNQFVDLNVVEIKQRVKEFEKRFPKKT